MSVARIARTSGGGGEKTYVARKGKRLPMISQQVGKTAKNRWVKAVLPVVTS